MSTVKNLSKSITSKEDSFSDMNKTVGKGRLQKLMEEESKMVEGRFKNYEAPGSNLPFCGRKYPNHAVYKTTFEDGKTYKVPLWVARWLNGIDVVAQDINGKIGSCSYPTHGFNYDGKGNLPSATVDATGVPTPFTVEAKRTQRFGFESMEFGMSS